MQQINWNKFEFKGESKQKSFEDLCYYLFCRKFGKTEGIRVDYNQVGIETYPIYDKSEKIWIGFQSKFFENKLADSTSIKQIKSSIKKAKNNYKNLNKIILYTHHSFGSKNPKYKKDIEKEAGKIKIEWFVDSNFQGTLTQPSNLDLAQLYFGLGDELGFIKNSTNPSILTFLQSSEYLEIPFVDKEKKEIKNIVKKIISLHQKDFLITGHPGSGKSIFIHKLLQVYGGLDQKDIGKMVEVLTDNNAVPILVNLKNCAIDSLENILRGRKNDCNVNGQSLGFIYLFDGLDELSEENADSILSQIYELKQKGNTKKLIISCRSGNPNKTKTKVYLKDITEYRIADLEEKHITKYFDAKRTGSKYKQLSVLKLNNPTLVKEIKDILLIKLLWDTIDELNETSTVLDLLNKKIDLLLSNPNHRKNIEELNLLNPKEKELLALNQDISFEFQKRFQFRFPQKDLQDLILKKFNRLDYGSANNILNYLADLFFENSYSNNQNTSSTYVYQHRRYQEYFLAQKLKTEYESNPRILRDLKVLSNRDFFEELFLKYLRKEYEKENNLAGIIELNLIDVYLGKHKGFGVDDSYYMNSSEFIPALASQNTLVFNELIEDENLQIKEKISIDFAEVKKQFERWKIDKNDFRSTDHLKSVRESGIASLIGSIVLFWKSGKKDIANEFRRQLNEIIKLYKEYNFLANLREHDLPRDPFWIQFENWIYIRLVIENEKVKDVFEKLIRKNYKLFSDEGSFSLEETPKEKLVKSFFRVCLREKRDDLFELLDDFNEYEFLAFLDILKSIEYLPIFVQSQSIHEKIKSFTQSFSQTLTEKDSFILFYKIFFGISLSEAEIIFAKTELTRLRERRQIDWHMYKTHVDFALLSYVLDENSFGKFLAKQDRHPFRYYNELNLYAALFIDFIDLLKGDKNIEAIVRDYIRYINFYSEGIHYGMYLKVDISFFWANIFADSNATQETKLKLKNRLLTKEYNIIPFSFYLNMNRLNPTLFNQLINESELKTFEDELFNWDDDFFSYVDRCFQLAQFFSEIRPNKSIDYISKGINHGMLRHGWRKDIIVSYLLVEALGILWKNNWESKETLKNYAEQVFDLAVRVCEITDGDETWQGPYNIVGLITDYDIVLAENFKRKLINKEGYHKFSNHVITSVLLGKVGLGFPIEEIEKEMNEYRKDYDYQEKPRSDYYEQKFTVYLKIAENDLYTNEEKKEAFEKTYNQIEEIKNHKIDYYLRDDDFKDEKLRFKKLCKKYKMEFNLSFDKKDEVKSKPKISEQKFIKEVKHADTKQKINELYKSLGNYDNFIVLSEFESWKILINKTFDVCKNIELFTNLLKKNSFPHTDFFTTNSKYFHLGLAVALDNLNTRQEILRYLFKNTGHGGFVNIMKAYEVNRDKEMCLLLFRHFLKFCDLIVN